MTLSATHPEKEDASHFRSHRHSLVSFLFERQWFKVLVLGVIGFLVRLPALQGQFIWDDEFLARDNPFIKSPILILEAFRHYLFPDSYSGHYRPMQNVSFILDYFVWNTNPYGFHLTNVLLHVTAGVLLFFLLRKLLPGILGPARDRSGHWMEYGSFLIALAWMIHPVHSAAIDFISGRADSLAFLFASAAWLLIFQARAIGSRRLRLVFYGLAICCGLLSLCSREIAGIWFALFLLYTLFFDRSINRRTKLISLVCCLLLVGFYAGLRQLPERRPVAGSLSDWSGSTRVVLMLRALGDYGRLMIFPSNLHMERSVFDSGNYQSNEAWRQSITSEYLSVAGLLLLSALIYGSCRKGEGQRIRIFGTSWFILGYLPISNIVDLGATVAEHWLYLPSVGFLIFLAGCAVDLPQRYRRTSIALACLALTGLGIRSVSRSSDWISPETFYQRTLAAGGISTRVVSNLAQIYANKGEYAKAELMLRQVLRISPDYPTARNNLAEVLAREGKRKEAETLLASSSVAAAVTRKDYPLTWMAAFNLAHLRHKEKDDKGAVAILDQARKDYPKTWELISFEAEILRETQGPDAGLHLVQNFAQENWWHYGAFMALGRLYAEKGEVLQADAALRHASWLDIHDVQALNLIAMIGVRQNRLDDACRAQRRAVARQPDEPRQYVMLSDILEKMGRTDEARAAIAQVSRLRDLAQAPVVAN